MIRGFWENFRDSFVSGIGWEYSNGKFANLVSPKGRINDCLQLFIFLIGFCVFYWGCFLISGRWLGVNKYEDRQNSFYIGISLTLIGWCVAFGAAVML